MKYLIYFLSVTFLIALQEGVFPFFKVFGVVPNLLLILIIVTTLKDKTYDFLFVALLAGIFLDLSSGLFFGSFSFGLLFLAYILHLLINNMLTFEINWKYLSITLAISMLFLAGFIFLYNYLAFRAHLADLQLSFNYFKSFIIIEFVLNLIFLFPMDKFAVGVKLLCSYFEPRQRIL